ncbi:HNH endonuclease [Candidatus Erwinia dacicola]|uniref:HNH nuclease domain-containing protein n=2 Tax=Candidatus Erwinia dacicola TaxID=252393 RepID=A0A1E7Z2R3_9GAMM|nr:HNH endonuclease [Candidatus Erwinia dacicola]OFC63056.1 hypothetical protein BBW68_07205 [Candidatus Erwinia dacicola]
MLTQERLKELLHYDRDTGVFTRLKTRSSRAKEGEIAGWPSSGGYLRVCVDGKVHFCHRLAWLYEHGEFPSAFMDHINGDRQDNRISNIRQVSLSQNGFNRKMQSTNTSGIKGVSWCKEMKKWRAGIMHEGKHIHVGYFIEKIEAAEAIEKVRNELHGAFANNGGKAA